MLPDDLKLEIVDSIDKVWAMKHWLGARAEHKFLGFDLETTGLSPYVSGAGIRMIQIGDKTAGWAVPWVGWGGAALECLKLWEGRYTGHNLSFDDMWLREHSDWSLPWERTDDTLIMAQIERPEKPNDLKTLTDLRVDPRASQGAIELKKAFKDNGWDWGTVPIDYPTYYIYAALDPVMAVYLREDFETDVKFKETYEMEMAVKKICNRMERIGMRVDLDYSNQKYVELKEQAKKNVDWGKENWGVSLTSNPQMADFFENRLGATFEKFTDSGAPSVAKEQMALFAKSGDPMIASVAKFVVDTKSLLKTADSYFDNFLTMNVDGILHPTIKTMGARTGRMSVTNPALQTIPSKDSLVRSAFIPNNPGELILSSDYSQVEMRLLAHFSNDEALQGAFHDADRTGEDFFSNLGKQIYNDPHFGKDDPRRKLVKSTLYGLIYGAGTQKIAETAKVPYEEMEPVVESIHATFPGIREFMFNIEKVGTFREETEGAGYVTTRSGRKIPADKGRVYSLVNYILQGTAAELMKHAVIRLDSAGYGEYMRMVIHDEVVLSMPEHMIEDAKPEIAEIMSYTDGEYAVNLLAEPEGGYATWGSKYANPE